MKYAIWSYYFSASDYDYQFMSPQQSKKKIENEQEGTKKEKKVGYTEVSVGDFEL